MSLLGSRDEHRQGELTDERAFGHALDEQRRRRAVVPRKLPRLTAPILVPEADQVITSYHRRDAIYRRSLIIADLFAAALAFSSAVSVGGTNLSLTCVILLPIVVLAAKLMGLYDRDELVFHKSTLNEAPKLFHLATLFALLARFLQGALVHGGLNTRQLLVLWASFLLYVMVGRTLARRIARRIAIAERCLIIGPSGDRMRLAHKLAASQRANTEVVGYLPLEDERRRAEEWNGHSRRRRSVTIVDLPEIVSELDVHRAIIIPGNAGGETMLDAISRAKAVGVKVSILPRMFEVVGSSVEFDDLDGVTVLGVRRFGLSRSSYFIKRTMDIACSSVGLVFVSPLMLSLAVAIKIDSPGPVFFRQMRVGRGGKPFPMLKFRSMVDGADYMKPELQDLNEADGLFKIADDPRITRIGRWIRKLSLDELPQLFNVLRGEMSLVGPRPLVLEDDQRVEGRHRRRLRMMPGMTGPWQVLGSSRIPLSEMVNIDYLYGANWSLWTDVKILLRTAEHVLGRRGQ